MRGKILEGKIVKWANMNQLEGRILANESGHIAKTNPNWQEDWQMTFYVFIKFSLQIFRSFGHHM